jgi:heterodisulfide reductase subunit C
MTMDDTLRIQDLDPLFKEELAQEPGCQHLLRCFACGVCTATCPVAEIEPEFSPSRIIRQILYGMRDQLLASPALWYCARCAQCSFSCPQDVRFLDIIQGLRNLAVREGVVSKGRADRLAQGEQLIQDLRRRLLAALLSAPEDDLDLKAELARVLDTMKIPPSEED